MNLTRQHAGVVVVGAGAAGATVASTLRTEGFDGPVTVVGAEDSEPYNRTAVNKSVLSGALDASQVLLPERTTPGVEWLPGDAAVHLDTARRQVQLSSGRTLPYGAVVLATGAAPRRLPPGVVRSGHDLLQSMHTPDDAERLRRIAVQDGAPIAVLGAGLVGSETASALAALGARVHLVERSSTPMVPVLGATAASWLARSHAAAVETAFGREIGSVHAVDDGLAITLDDGTRLAVAAAVTCMGTAPSTSWLSDAGLDSPGGIAVDPYLRVRGIEGAYTAGDVVRRPACDEASWAGGHWALTVSQARYVAGTVMRDLAGDHSAREPFGETSSFTTQVHGTKVTVVGNPTAHHRERVVDGDPASDAFTTVLLDRGDVVRAAIGVGPALPALRLRAAVGRHVSQTVAAPEPAVSGQRA